MATLNLYVSDTLKAEMAEHEQLNWSQIAVQAFENAIALERTKTMPTNQAAAARLRISRNNAVERREAEGEALGQQWAQETAEFDELERVAHLLWPERTDANSALYRLASAVLDDEQPHPTDVDQVTEGLFGRKSPTLAEITGFVAGAERVYSEVDLD